MLNSPIRIALDVMGSDDAPRSEIRGALNFLALNQSSALELILVGDEKIIKEELAKNKDSQTYLDKILIHHTSDVITFSDKSTDILNKKDSSLYQGFHLIKIKKADAFISAGNTGAMLVCGTFVAGRIEGFSRPTIGSYFPAKGVDGKVFVLDVGANIEVKPTMLLEFAILADAYVRKSGNIDKPKIGLLNIGEEKGKGIELYREANKLLSESKLNFVGNIEGNDVLSGNIDIVICDGYTGNILLKFAESFPGILKNKIKLYADNSLLAKIKVGLLMPVLKQIMKSFDYQVYGGVPILGINGTALVCHGKSTPLAFTAALTKAAMLVESEFLEEISKSLIN